MDRKKKGHRHMQSGYQRPYQVGDSVILMDGRSGIIRYLGTLHFTKGDYAGLELTDLHEGKNNGEVKGTRYFECPDGRGIFVKSEKIVSFYNKEMADVAAITSETGVTSGDTTRSKTKQSARSLPTSAGPAGPPPGGNSMAIDLNSLTVKKLRAFMKDIGGDPGRSKGKIDLLSRISRKMMSVNPEKLMKVAKKHGALKGEEALARTSVVEQVDSRTTSTGMLALSAAEQKKVQRQLDALLDTGHLAVGDLVEVAPNEDMVKLESSSYNLAWTGAKKKFLGKKGLIVSLDKHTVKVQFRDGKTEVRYPRSCVTPMREHQDSLKAHHIFEKKEAKKLHDEYGYDGAGHIEDSAEASADP